jgi:hypothetical protein
LSGGAKHTTGLSHLPSRFLTTQMFHRFSCDRPEDLSASRLSFFVEDILPKFGDVMHKKTMIFIPSYFDFVRLRNHFRREKMSFAQARLIQFSVVHCADMRIYNTAECGARTYIFLSCAATLHAVHRALPLPSPHPCPRHQAHHLLWTASLRIVLLGDVEHDGLGQRRHMHSSLQQV